jgi:hypothetical protein
MNVGTANTVTVPADLGYTFELGTQIVIVQFGVGQTTITGSPGVTILSEGSKYITKAQYAVASLIKVGADTWLLSGNLTV